MVENDIDLTILVPVLDECDNVATLLPRLRRVLEGLQCRHEILVVDGGSRDRTVEVARALGAPPFRLGVVTTAMGPRPRSFFFPLPSPCVGQSASAASTSRRTFSYCAGVMRS